MDVENLPAYIKLDLLSSKELIDISLKLLEKGSLSPSIAFLAGESNLPYLEAKNHIIDYLKESSYELPDSLSAKKTVMIDIFNKIKKSEISPQDGARYIISKIQDSELDGDTVGDHLSIEKLIGYQYQIDDITEGDSSFSGIEAKNVIDVLEKNIISFAKVYINRYPSK